MKQLYPTTVYETAEARQLARTLRVSTLIGASWVAYLIVILVGLYINDWKQVVLGLTAGASLSVPVVLFRPDICKPAVSRLPVPLSFSTAQRIALCISCCSSKRIYSE